VNANAKGTTCDKTKGDQLRTEVTIAKKSDLCDFRCIMNVLESSSIPFLQDKGTTPKKILRDH